MRKALVPIGILLLSALLLSAAPAARLRARGTPAKPAATPWSFEATFIEACSCRLFCPCYFNSSPEHHSCEFNIAANVMAGHLGDVSLKGARYWLTGDLGEDFGPGKTSPWLVVTFDPSVTKPQRDALVKILTEKIYPWKWGDLHTDESAITWEIKGTAATARLANGKGEMLLDRWTGNDGGPAVLKNVRYFAVSRNDGFVMYKSKVHRWDGFGHKFDYSGRNAFTIHVVSGGTM